MSYDPLRERARNAVVSMQARIRQARQEIRDAQTKLAALEQLECDLNLEAIVDAIPSDEEPAE